MIGIFPHHNPQVWVTIDDNSGLPDGWARFAHILENSWPSFCQFRSSKIDIIKGNLFWGKSRKLQLYIYIYIWVVFSEISLLKKRCHEVCFGLVGFFIDPWIGRQLGQEALGSLRFGMIKWYLHQPTSPKVLTNRSRAWPVYSPHMFILIRKIHQQKIKTRYSGDHGGTISFYSSYMKSQAVHCMYDEFVMLIGEDQRICLGISRHIHCSRKYLFLRWNFG